MVFVLAQGTGQKKHRVIYILDVLAINREFYGLKPLKERCVNHAYLD